MTTVYIDLVFLLNLAADYLLLLVGGRMAGAVLHRGRIAAGAALGALYACALFLPGSGVLARWPCRLGCGAVMALIAYGRGPALLRSALMFFAASAALGGALFAAHLMSGGPAAADGRLLLSLFAAGCFVLSLCFRRVGRHTGTELVRLEIRLLGKTVRLTALRDTGHTLTDPVTNRPVVVAYAGALSHLFPVTLCVQSPTECASRLAAAGVKGVRLLPFRAVGTECGLLAAVRSDGVMADGVPLGPLLVALSPGPVSDGGGYQCLLGGV